MPGFSGTGPMGAGPMTGAGQGFCNPAYASYWPGYADGIDNTVDNATIFISGC